MPEGLSAAEVGKEIAEHRKHGHEAEAAAHRGRLISIIEAIVLSLVAVVAAYSGFAAAKWGTESSVSLAKASALRTKANRADLEAVVTRTLDSASFNAWFTAFVAGNARAEQTGGQAVAARLSPRVQRLAGHRPGPQPARAARPGLHAAIRHPPAADRHGR